MTIRRYFYEILEPAANPNRLSWANIVISILIIISTLVSILETEPTIREPYAHEFQIFNMGIGIFFLIEFFIRIWIAAENPAYKDSRFGRFGWLFSKGAIIDMIALSPMFFSFFITEAFWIRFLRIIRIVRIVRLGPVGDALNIVYISVYKRRFELGITMVIAIMMMFASACLLYFTEGRAQPEAFGSIPRALWWSIVTLTTIGYGDVYPITLLGRISASLIAISGIGIIAMPTGIFAAAFTETVQERKMYCPKCGGLKVPKPDAIKPE